MNSYNYALYIMKIYGDNRASLWLIYISARSTLQLLFCILISPFQIRNNNLKKSFTEQNDLTNQYFIL